MRPIAKRLTRKRFAHTPAPENAGADSELRFTVLLAREAVRLCVPPHAQLLRPDRRRLGALPLGIGSGHVMQLGVRFRGCRLFFHVCVLSCPTRGVSMSCRHNFSMSAFLMRYPRSRTAGSVPDRKSVV